MKNGVNWGNGFAIGDSSTENCPLKCLIFQVNDKTDDSIKWKLMYSIISF